MSKIHKDAEFFENPKLKEYLFNLQVSQKISLREFLFTKTTFKLSAIFGFLLWYNQYSSSAIKWLIIIYALLFLFFFKRNRITKKEKYFIPKDNETKTNNELFLYSIYGKKIKNILKQKFFIFLLAIYLPNVSYGTFVSNINQSTNTQNQNNEIDKNENEEMLKRAKLKNILYLSQEKKYFITQQINEQIKIDSDIEINIIRTKIEKVKHETKQ
ncbi:hypothetical protein [Aliarcobacter butzleri]|uniref:hypothetical protein n=1 Tax=Aliarcobacter butzleri TaxID=28197 RepID=UPI00126A1240|nr:hypothetical protein [Aliarcobacter butzleri]